MGSLCCYICMLVYRCCYGGYIRAINSIYIYMYIYGAYDCSCEQYEVTYSALIRPDDGGRV